MMEKKLDFLMIFLLPFALKSFFLCDFYDAFNNSIEI